MFKSCLWCCIVCAYSTFKLSERERSLFHNIYHDIIDYRAAVSKSHNVRAKLVFLRPESLQRRTLLILEVEKFNSAFLLDKRHALILRTYFKLVKIKLCVSFFSPVFDAVCFIESDAIMIILIFIRYFNWHRL